MTSAKDNFGIEEIFEKIVDKFQEQLLIEANRKTTNYGSGKKGVEYERDHNPRLKDLRKQDNSRNCAC